MSLQAWHWNRNVEQKRSHLRKETITITVAQEKRQNPMDPKKHSGAGYRAPKAKRAHKYTGQNPHVDSKELTKSSVNRYYKNLYHFLYILLWHIFVLSPVSQRQDNLALLRHIFAISSKVQQQDNLAPTCHIFVLTFALQCQDNLVPLYCIILCITESG